MYSNQRILGRKWFDGRIKAYSNHLLIKKKKKKKLCLHPGHSTFIVVSEVLIFHPLISTHIDGVALWGFQQPRTVGQAVIRSWIVGAWDHSTVTYLYSTTVWN